MNIDWVKHRILFREFLILTLYTLPSFLLDVYKILLVDHALPDLTEIEFEELDLETLDPVERFNKRSMPEESDIPIHITNIKGASTEYSRDYEPPIDNSKEAKQARKSIQDALKNTFRDF